MHMDIYSFSIQYIPTLRAVTHSVCHTVLCPQGVGKITAFSILQYITYGKMLCIDIIHSKGYRLMLDITACNLLRANAIDKMNAVTAVLS